MRLWTIQAYEAWVKLNNDGVITSDGNYVCDDFRPAYLWMAEQLELFIGYKPHQGSLPLWAWYQWGGQNKSRPDLRFSGHLPKNKRGVLIEFEINPQVVLLSDFDLWHYVLNYWFLLKTEIEGDLFEKELVLNGLSPYKNKPLPEKFHSRVEESWKRIFDLDWVNEDITSSIEAKKIQACIWELKIDYVCSTREFIAR